MTPLGLFLVGLGFLALGVLLDRGRPVSRWALLGIGVGIGAAGAALLYRSSF